jgi:hypothetical protein
LYGPIQSIRTGRHAVFGLTVPGPRLDYWPEDTVISDTDIVVAGISLRRLADVCGTPAVHSAASVIPDSGQRPDPDAVTGVLVARVLVVAEHHSGAPVIQVDARLDNLRLVWSEARIVGARVSTRSRISLLVRKPRTVDIASTNDVLVMDLPARVAVGHLLAIPSRSISSALGRQLHPVTGRLDGQPDSVFADSGPTRSSRWETTD